MSLKEELLQDMDKAMSLMPGPGRTTQLNFTARF